jgi:rhodanese-related sulfurtransferase
MTEQQINLISVAELKKHYDETPNLCLIDVRENDEWESEHIPGAYHIPKDKLSGLIELRAPDRNHPVYLYCQGGIRSLQAAHTLLEMGYQQVYSVEGGIDEWENAGYPIKKGA